jgi:glutamyl-tRNA synthetase
MSAVRTRFAPSPTGYLHIGGARTALFNYLFARHHGGTFVLRVEDTDRERSTPESIQAILESMGWLDLDWDEGPFFQSQRSSIYREHVDRLLAADKAYRCTCTPEEIEEKRQRAIAAGHKPMYDRTCRDRRHGADRKPFAVRFKMPLDGETLVRDAVKGGVLFQNSELDDLVLVRSDGTPTYNFCAVVDDALMEISHVIRGEDHLANTPKQIGIYRAFGYEPPTFAHVPLILGLDRSRLSKRHGATSVTAYRDAGYLPAALNNYLVRLGWSHGDQEIFTRAELIEKFTFESVGSAAGVFNPEKLDWVNFQHIKLATPLELAAACKPFIDARGWPTPGDDAWLARAVATLQERAKTLVELLDQARFYLCDDIDIDPAAAAKHLGKANPDALRDLRQALAEIAEWNAAAIQSAFEGVLARYQIGLGKLAQPVRVALTGGAVSPGIYEVIDVLGRERTLARLDRALPLVGQVPKAAAGTA